MTIAYILDRAADRLSKPGTWHQGGYGTEQQTCMGGAINLAVGNSFYDCSGPAIDAAYYLRDFLGGEAAGPWNDAKGRTQAEVVTVLRAAAVEAREQGK